MIQMRVRHNRLVGNVSMANRAQDTEGKFPTTPTRTVSWVLCIGGGPMNDEQDGASVAYPCVACSAPAIVEHDKRWLCPRCFDAALDAEAEGHKVVDGARGRGSDERDDDTER